MGRIYNLRPDDVWAMSAEEVDHYLDDLHLLVRHRSEQNRGR